MVAAKKTSLALPEDLLEEVEAAAEERGMSRNKFVVRVLREAVKARRDAAITQRLNKLFEDKSLLSVQSQEAWVWGGLAEWDDEPW